MCGRRPDVPSGRLIRQHHHRVAAQRDTQRQAALHAAAELRCLHVELVAVVGEGDPLERDERAHHEDVVRRDRKVVRERELAELLVQLAEGAPPVAAVVVLDQVARALVGGAARHAAADRVGEGLVDAVAAEVVDLRVEHPHSLEHLLQCAVVLRHDVEHARRHRLLVVAAHLRHQPEVEQRDAAVGQAQQVALVRVAVDEAVAHQLHREAAHRRPRERLTLGVGQRSRRRAVNPFRGEHARRGERRVDLWHDDAELGQPFGVQRIEAADVARLRLKIELREDAAAHLVQDALDRRDEHEAPQLQQRARALLGPRASRPEAGARGAPEPGTARVRPRRVHERGERRRDHPRQQREPRVRLVPAHAFEERKARERARMEG